MRYCLFCNKALLYNHKTMHLLMARRCPHCSTSFPSKMTNPDYFRYIDPQTSEARRMRRKRRLYDDPDAFGKADRNA